MGPAAGRSLLDVGGGHAQLAEPLLSAGFDVTVVGSADSCRSRLGSWLDANRLRYQTSDLLALPFDAGRFDVVISFRLLPHLERWRALLSEMARVARATVVVDYPTRRSVNAVAGALFSFKKGVEGDTRPFTVFRDAEIADAMRAVGFAPVARRGEFFLPMALHRGIGSRALSRVAEGAAGALGLVALLGSPVILRADRR